MNFKPLSWAVAGAAAVVTVSAAYGAGRASTAPALTAARRAASVDPLTGLANRAGLDAELERRGRAGQPFAVLLVDLDGFKQVNDTFGHAAGDQVLTAVAGRLARLVAGHGLAARLGGDEFVLVVDAPVGVFGTLLATDVVREVARPVVTASGAVAVAASVGVVHALAGDDPRAVLHAADTAMYQAKTAGGGMREHEQTLDAPPAPARRPVARLRDLTGAGRDLAAGPRLAGVLR